MFAIGRKAALLFLICGVCAGSLSAQVTTGTISGVVKDESGAVLARSSVTVKNTATGATRVVSSDDSGRYRAAQLALGNYDVQSEMAGFVTEVRQGIALTVGSE